VLSVLLPTKMKLINKEGVPNIFKIGVNNRLLEGIHKMACLMHRKEVQVKEQPKERGYSYE
jgi:hypothetical protein